MTVTKIEIGDILDDCDIDPEMIRNCKINEGGELWIRTSENTGEPDNK